MHFSNVYCTIQKEIRKQSQESTHADCLKIVFVYVDGDTELERAVDIVIARAKRIYISIIKVKKLFSLFLAIVAVFSKRNRKHVLRVSIEL